jgi:hypothetical protein
MLTQCENKLARNGNTPRVTGATHLATGIKTPSQALREQTGAQRE